MGIVPPRQDDVAAQTSIPVVYHGGVVMRGVTVHTIFWAPRGFRFSPAPAGAGGSYEPLVQQFFTDVAHDSGTTSNAFSILGQYGDGAGPGSYSIAYNTTADSVDDTDPYPKAHRCASPSGIGTCLTDLQLRREIERVIASHDPAGRGLHDVWFILLPPDVDTCVASGQCGTNAFAGYHSLSNVGAAPTIYSVIPDPLIELPPIPGADPEGNPEAEATLDTMAHEMVEAMTNPEGVGWMDPNGFEVADKCENGPQEGTPLGTAPNGAPFNQVINGHDYLLQTMWSNPGGGCVQGSTAKTSPLPLATVSLRQFSSSVRGNTGIARGGVPVVVGVVRASTLVALGVGVTRANGAWGPLKLRSAAGAPHAVGDDRDAILVSYGRGGPKPDQIETGNGGDPFNESGWTGWFDLDHGYAVRPDSIALAPCSQTGVLGLEVGGMPAPAPIEQCDTETGFAVVHTPRLQAATPISMSSEDNRAVFIDNPNGALVRMTIPVGEPGSVSAQRNRQVLFTPTGFPSCTANLRAQTVRCTGLVPRASYSVVRRRGHAVRTGRADRQGAVVLGGFPGAVVLGGFPGAVAIRGGDVLALRRAHGRTLTTLHVAHLRVEVTGNETIAAGGTCEPGDYWGPPLDTPPASPAIGFPGAGGTGRVCPRSGKAAGLSLADIAQTDDLGGGQTRTEVPAFEGTSPTDGETLFGPFIALARTGVPGPHDSVMPATTRVSLTITRSTGGGPVFLARNVGTARGVRVARLPTGTYLARWLLSDANGDTRAIRTHFVQEP
jgi:hypothetical protein